MTEALREYAVRVAFTGDAFASIPTSTLCTADQVEQLALIGEQLGLSAASDWLSLNFPFEHHPTVFCCDIPDGFDPDA